MGNKSKKILIKVTQKSSVKRIRILSKSQIEQVIELYNKNNSIHKISVASRFTWKTINKVIDKAIKAGEIIENQVTLANKERHTNRYDNILNNIYISIF